MRKFLPLLGLLLCAIPLSSQGIIVGLQGHAPAGLLLVSDNFTRGNSANLGANWSNTLGVSDPIQILSNAAVQTSATFSAEGWTANVFTANQFSKVTFSGIGTTRSLVAVRMQTAANTYYACGKDTNANATKYIMEKVIAGTQTSLWNPATTTVTAGDVVELDVVGTTLTCIVNGSTFHSLTDASISTAAQPGLIASGTGTTAQFTLWSGGNL